MRSDIEPSGDNSPEMTAYELEVWHRLNEFWDRRNNRRGLPNWAGAALERTGTFAEHTATRVAGVVPEAVKGSAQTVGDALSNAALRPAIEAAIAMVELVNEWALELNNPRAVERIASKRGLILESFTDLRHQDLKVCDRLLAGNTLRWRTLGVAEGGAMGALAMVPVAGLPVALTADVLILQVLSTAIAARIAYSYGYDAKDPAEQLFIERMVRRSFLLQAAKAEPLREAGRAAGALRGRVRWSPQLRNNHRLIAALEKLMQHLGPAGARVPVQNVAKVVPVMGVLIGAGMNSTILANVSKDARRYCQTRFLCDKYGLPTPEALNMDVDTDEESTDDPPENESC